uniref:Uncharacterized protein n=1 Tax=Anguilla anguilla TaxID=7936 RepID=A0A0E9TZJ5_ANGAN
MRAKLVARASMCVQDLVFSWTGTLPPLS